jgi:hypothetical protein
MPSAIATKKTLSVHSAQAAHQEGLVQFIAKELSSALRRNKPFFYLCRGIVFYHLAQYDRAMQNFSMALRLNWRNENVVEWIGRTERAHRKAMRRPRLCSGPAEIPLPVTARDRPGRHCLAGPGIEVSLLVPSLSHVQNYGLQTRVI